MIINNYEKENNTMSEEIKKEVQDAELNPEKLDKVAGGFIIDQNKID